MVEPRYVQAEIHRAPVVPWYRARIPADREKITNEVRGSERIAPSRIPSPSEQGSPGESEFQIRRHIEADFFPMEQGMGDIRATADFGNEPLRAEMTRDSEEPWQF